MSYDTLVLSGGGIWGFTILGAVQCAEDLGLLKGINNYIGTSIGSVICYMLAIGYKPTEIVVTAYTLKWLDKLKHFDITSFMNGNGATSFTAIYESLEYITLDKIGKLITLGKLQSEYGKTLVCTTYNMTTCQTEYLGPTTHPDLPCLTALRMSCNIPLIFDRFKYMNNFYIDGGITDNFPIEHAKTIATRMIGVYLNIPESSMQDKPGDGTMSYFLKLLQVPIIHATRQRVEKFDSEDKSLIVGVLVNRNLTNPTNFDIDSKMRLDMFSSGYQQFKSSLDDTGSELVEDEIL